MSISKSNRSYDSLSDLFDDLSFDIDSISPINAEVLHFPTTLLIGSQEYLYQLPEEEIKTLKFTMENNIRVIVKEYDESSNFLITTDVTNIEYIYLQSKSKFISFSAYQYENAKESQLTKKVNITIESIDDATLETLITAQPEMVGELKGESLVNYGNYRKGYYKKWGGEYDYSDTLFCQRNKYMINPSFEYYFNTNDSRFKLAVQQYDESGKWISYVGEMKNGDVFKPTSEKVKYMAIRGFTTVWGLGLDVLMGHGLWANFSPENKVCKTEKINESQFNLSDINSWRIGEFSDNTGEYGINEKTICTTKYIVVSSTKKRRIRTWDTYIKMFIIEYDESGNMLNKQEVTNGIAWVPQETTSFISITIRNSNSLMGKDVYEMIKNKEIYPSIDVLVKYNYNTKMKNITAHEFVQKINVGWNLGNSFDSYYGDWGTEHRNLETMWGNPTVAQELIDYVAEQGFNSIRIPVSWYLNTYLDENGNYRVYDYWIDRVQDVVDYAIQKGLYVLMNTHFDSKFLLLGNNEEQMEKEYKYAKDLWTHIATFYKNYDEHLIFESYNELYVSTWTYTDIGNDHMTKFNQIFVDAVRATGGNNANRVLCVQTLTSFTNNSSLNNFVMPKDTVKNKIVVQVHNYNDNIDQSIEPLFINLEKFSKRMNAPVIIGEFAVNNGGDKIEYKPYKISNYVARAASRGIKVFYWDDGNLKHYNLINRRAFKSSDKESINAILHPKIYSTKTIQILSELDDFYYNSMDRTTGELVEDKWWGTIVTKRTAPIPEGAEIAIFSLGVVGLTDFFRIHYTAFFDENKKLISISGSNFGSLIYIFAIPEGARYVRIMINNSYVGANETTYAKYFACHELGLSLSYVTKDFLYEDPNKKGKYLYLEPTDGGDFFNDFNKIDFNLYDSWVMGSYALGKRMVPSENTMAINQFLRIEKGRTLTYKSSSNVVKCTIMQYSEVMKGLKSITLSVNQSVTLADETTYVSVQISAPNQSTPWTDETYRTWFLGGSKISF